MTTFKQIEQREYSHLVNSFRDWLEENTSLRLTTCRLYATWVQRFLWLAYEHGAETVMVYSDEWWRVHKSFAFETFGSAHSDTIRISTARNISPAVTKFREFLEDTKLQRIVWIEAPPARHKQLLVCDFSGDGWSNKDNCHDGLDDLYAPRTDCIKQLFEEPPVPDSWTRKLLGWLKSFFLGFFILTLLCGKPVFAEGDVDLRPSISPSVISGDSTNAIEVKTGGYDSSKGDLNVTDKALEKLQPVPNVPAEAPKKVPPVQAVDSNRHRIGFWKKFHPDHIETYHPKLNKGWNAYMFIYDHGLRQSLDITSKVCQIALPFVVN